MIIFPNRSQWECGNGWNHLIEELIEKITPYAEDIELTINIIQIKEKFGMLTVYPDSYMEPIASIIDEYEKKSMTICEECGDPGEFRNDLGWKQTLCDIHYQSKKKR